jgi:hypothetical protein
MEEKSKGIREIRKERKKEGRDRRKASIYMSICLDV